MPYPGLLITLESIDGLGKTVQTQRLVESLRNIGHDPYVTKEPGDLSFGSRVGPGIRELLFKTPGTHNLAPGVADLLFLADHEQNVHDVREQLNQGRVVISDRYADSQFAYASSATKKAPKWAMDIFRQRYGVTPDLTILLVARGAKLVHQHEGEEQPDGSRYVELANKPEDIAWALKRARTRTGVEAGKQDGKTWNDVEEQRIIQNGYIDLLKTENRTRMINVWPDSSREAIAEEIFTHVLVALRGDHPTQPYLEGLNA